MTNHGRRPHKTLRRAALEPPKTLPKWDGIRPSFGEGRTLIRSPSSVPNRWLQMAANHNEKITTPLIIEALKTHLQNKLLW